MAVADGSDRSQPRLTLPSGDEQRLALVLSGGGNLGIVQTAFLQHLIERGVVPDLIVGTSVGALNGAFLAFHPHDIHGLAELWLTLKDKRLWHRNLLRIGRNLLGHGTSVYSSRFLRDLILPHVPVDEIAASEIPLFITATNLSRGGKHVFTRGPLVDAILASSSIPGLFPPVRIGDEWFTDAGIASGLDLETAILQGATQIIAVDLGSDLSPYHPTGLVDLLGRAMAIAVKERTDREIDHFASDVPTVIWRPGLRAESFGSFHDVERLYQLANELAPVMIDQALDANGAWIPNIYEGVVPVAKV